MLEQQKVNNSIIATLAYSDIFSYPLSMSQIHKYYLGKKISFDELRENVKRMVERGFIQSKGQYYFLNGKQNYYSIRKRRQKESVRKLKIAKNVASLLSKIPTVKFIGISGSLSMKNTEKREDIDLFFITSKNTLWITRFVVNLFLIAKRIKRSRRDSIGVDTICPNMFVSEDNMLMNQNIFTAHEISQLMPLYNKQKTYEKFIAQNRWVLKRMPHVVKVKSVPSQYADSLFSLVRLLDGVFYIVQLAYMKRRITTEKLSQNLAAFHPKDKTQFVITLHKNRTKSYQNALFSSQIDQPQTKTHLASNFTPGY